MIHKNIILDAGMTGLVTGFVLCLFVSCLLIYKASKAFGGICS